MRIPLPRLFAIAAAAQSLAAPKPAAIHTIKNLPDFPLQSLRAGISNPLRSRARLLLFALLAVGSAVAGPTDPVIGEWATVGNGPSRSGFYPATLGQFAIVPGWTRQTYSSLNPVVISDGKIFLTANCSAGCHDYPIFAALDLQTGAEIWSESIMRHYLGPPTLHDGMLYFQADDSITDVLYAVDASTGTVKWTAPAKAASPAGAPAAYANRVWTTGSHVDHGKLDGFDTATGEHQFQGTIGDQNYGGTASFYEGIIYTSGPAFSLEGQPAGGFLAASDPRLGVELWRTMGLLNRWGTPVILNGRATVVDQGVAVTIDLRSRGVIWTKESQDIVGMAATDGDTVYIVQGATIRAYAAASGVLRGSYDPHDPTASYGLEVFPRPLITNDLVMLGTDTKTFIFDKASFQLRATLPTGGSLSYAQGVLYTAHPTGGLASYVFEGVNEPSPTPRPSPTPFASRVSSARTRLELLGINRTRTLSADGSSYPQAISANGRYALFQSFADDLTDTPDENGAEDLFWRDLETGVTRLVSINYAGTAAARGAGDAHLFGGMTPDGRFVIFSSDRFDFVPGNDPNRGYDVFVRDMQSGRTVCASVDSDGVPAGGGGNEITPDGRFVLFMSESDRLAATDTNGTGTDVFLRDLQTNTTTHVSSNFGTMRVEGAGLTPDARFVLLKTGDQEEGGLYLRDLQAHTTVSVAVSDQGQSPRPGFLKGAHVSPDGRFVVFRSTAQDLVPSAGGEIHSRIFLRDMQAHTTIRIGEPFFRSVDVIGAVSADFRYIATLAVSPESTGSQVYVYDRTTGVTQQLITGDVYAFDMDPSGRFFLLQTRTDFLVDQDTQGRENVFLFDRLLGTTLLVSHDLSGSFGGDEDSQFHLGQRPFLSADGQTMLFYSASSNLVATPRLPPFPGGYLPLDHRLRRQDRSNRSTVEHLHPRAGRERG